MQRLRGCPSIIVFLFYFACLWSATVGLCPIHCRCNDDDLRVWCNEAGLDIVPITLNPELRHLHLSRNRIKGTLSSFGVYRNLRELDISRNQLSSIGEGNFQVQKHLTVLLLNGNSISTLANNTFRGLSALQILDLNDNLLEVLHEGVLNPLKSLEKLDLSRNRIDDLPSRTFSGLVNLKTLLLRGNKLKAVPSTAFRNLTSLLMLNLGLNTFKTIPEGSFASLTNLEELSLDGCGISRIHPGSFSGLTSMLTFRIQDNQLKGIPDLRGVARLEKVRVGRNLFSDVGGRAFRGLRYLKSLDLSGSKHLERVLREAFADNGNLERVDLSECPHLKVIEDGAFEGLPNLRHVFLRADALTRLNPRLLPWDELETLDLRDNPLECDCQLLWLRNLLLRRNFSTSMEEVGCVGPDPDDRQLLLDIPIEDFECGSRDSRRQLIIGVVVGTLVVLAILAAAAFRYRTRLAGLLKSKWGGGRKEPQYQKTSGDDDIMQVAKQSLKDTPVTEL